jgi:hypothetical protein
MSGWLSWPTNVERRCFTNQRNLTDLLGYLLRETRTGACCPRLLLFPMGLSQGDRKRCIRLQTEEPDDFLSAFIRFIFAFVTAPTVVMFLVYVPITLFWLNQKAYKRNMHGSGSCKMNSLIAFRSP